MVFVIFAVNVHFLARPVLSTPFSLVLVLAAPRHDPQLLPAICFSINPPRGAADGRGSFFDRQAVGPSIENLGSNETCSARIRPAPWTEGRCAPNADPNPVGALQATPVSGYYETGHQSD